MDWTLPSTKKIWNLCGLDIFTVALSWLDTSLFPPPPQINQTSIVLIPKISNPTSMKDLKPISLCNVLYKIISQTLANHLNPLLHKCISLKQFFFFVERRSIFDNVLIVFEIIHHMKCKSKGKMRVLALKIGIDKDFDRVY